MTIVSLLDVISAEPRASELRAAACELLVTRHRNLVWSCVRHYQGSPESTEDLMQVGYVGLLKAINNFDPAVGGSLAGLRAALHRRRDQAAFPRQALAGARHAVGPGAACWSSARRAAS